MKKSVYYTGITSAMLMLFGCMFKIMHWPGASIMLILSVFLFCFYFLPVALIANYRSQEIPKNRALHIITFIVFFISVMGVLFKVMHWPGAGIFLIVGLPLPFIVFLPAYLYSTRNEKKDNSMNFLGIMFGLTFLAVFSVLLALSISKQVLRNGITRDYSIEKTTEFTHVALNGLAPTSDIRKESDELFTYIEQLKNKLLEASFNERFIKSKDNMWEMDQVDSKAPTSQVLFTDNEKEKFNELRKKVQAYGERLLTVKDLDPKLAELIKALFNTEVIAQMEANGNVNELDWEQREFANKQLIFVLGALSQIQSNVRVVELEYLASLK